MEQQQWEQIPQNQAGALYRLKVPGGWLVKEVSDVQSILHPDSQGHNFQDGYYWRTTITFMPDAKHEWLKDKTPVCGSKGEPISNKGIAEWCDANGAEMKELQPYHVRVKLGLIIIDIFPKSKKFHNITIHERGDISDSISNFLTSQLINQSN